MLGLSGHSASLKELTAAREPSATSTVGLQRLELLGELLRNCNHVMGDLVMVTVSFNFQTQKGSLPLWRLRIPRQREFLSGPHPGCVLWAGCWEERPWTEPGGVAMALQLLLAPDEARSLCQPLEHTAGWTPSHVWVHAELTSRALCWLRGPFFWNPSSHPTPASSNPTFL